MTAGHSSPLAVGLIGERSLGFRIARAGASLAGLAALVLMLGPFQGEEQEAGLSDGQAHAIAFFVITLGLFLWRPRAPRPAIGALALAMGAIVETLQWQIGRTGSVSDWLADGFGIGLAVIAWSLWTRLARPSTAETVPPDQRGVAIRERLWGAAAVGGARGLAKTGGGGGGKATVSRAGDPISASPSSDAGAAATEGVSTMDGASERSSVARVSRTGGGSSST